LSSRSSKASFVRGSGGTIAIKLFGTGGLLVFNILLPRIVGTESYGEYVYIITWINILSMIGLFGLSPTAIKFIAEYSEAKRYDLLVGFIKSSFGLALLFSTIITILAGLFLGALHYWGKFSLYRAFPTGLLLIPAFSLLNLLLFQIRGFKSPVVAETLFTLIRPALLCTGVIAYFWWAEFPSSAESVLWIELCVVCILTVTSLAIVNRNLPVSLLSHGALYETSHWLKVALPLLLMSGYATINARADIVILGFFNNSFDVGIYNAAVKISALIPFGLGPINNVVSPYISSHFFMNQKIELQAIVRLAASGILLIGFPVALCVVLFPGKLLSIFGPDFTVASKALVVLAFGQLVGCLCGSVVFILSMTGNQKYASKAMGAGALLNIVLNFALIPKYGIVGAATATAIATVFWNLLMLLAVIKRLRLNPTVFPFISGSIRNFEKNN